MLDTILSFLDEFAHNFRISDAVDILLMSLFLYSALVWFKETASRRVLMGVLVLVAIYFSARAFDMYLTSLVFHTGFAALVIVLIVVFQEDLRRMFERVAGWGALRRLRDPHSAEFHVDVLVEAAFAMAAAKTGALIVLPGRDPIERHIEGGIELGGRASLPLLLSIFDAHSAGHDGAVIVDHGQIDRFAAHLPSSRNVAELAARGTRHAAALGLSECCDALVMVVSEERGVVSVAQDGRLRRMKTAAELKHLLERFVDAKHPQAGSGFLRRYVSENGLLKLLAIGLTCVAWFVLAYNPSTVQRTFVVPIEYRSLPEDLVLGDGTPTEARVTLSGSERNFRFLAPETMRISVNLSQAQPGSGSFPITENNIALPANLNLYRIEPAYLELDLQKMGEPPKPPPQPALPPVPESTPPQPTPPEPDASLRAGDDLPRAALRSPARRLPLSFVAAAFEELGIAGPGPCGELRPVDLPAVVDVIRLRGRGKTAIEALLHTFGQSSPRGTSVVL
jgi:uncharacterized protein (TIGR00159 family)